MPACHARAKICSDTQATAQLRLPLVERIEEVHGLPYDDAPHSLERAHPVAVPTSEGSEEPAKPIGAPYLLEEVRVVRGIICGPRESASRVRKGIRVG